MKTENNKQIVLFLLLVLFQVMVFSNINFLGYINPYIYIYFILFYPIRHSRLTFLLVSFLLGLTIDMFSDSGGIHAAASVTIAFTRPLALQYVFGFIFEHQTLNFKKLEFLGKLRYIALLTFIHHFILFFLESFQISTILMVLQKTVFSSIFTIILCLIFSSFYSKKKT